MNTEIDGIRAWIAMEKARARNKATARIKPVEVVMMYAMKSGYNTVTEIAIYRGFAFDKKESKKRTGNEIQRLVDFKLVERTGRTKPVLGSSLYVYRLTEAGKRFLRAMDDCFDDIYHTEFKPDSEAHLQLYLQ
jgi:hypothetical protein